VRLAGSSSGGVAVTNDLSSETGLLRDVVRLFSLRQKCSQALLIHLSHPKVVEELFFPSLASSLPAPAEDGCREQH